MSQLATIFEKIKEDFFINHVEEATKEDYSLVFSPFSAGFTNDDFLFLDSNSASLSGASARKYNDDLYSFSQISNTIPREKNFWAVSGNRNDLLYNPYKIIIDHLKYLDPETLTIEMLYEHPLFFDALEVIDSDEKVLYYSFFEQKNRLTKAIATLKESLTASNKTIIALDLKMKEEHLIALDEKWHSEGSKQKIESKILETIKDEFNRFVQKQTKIKSHLLHPKTHHTDYFPSFCSPNKLYKSNELEWTKIKINTPELERLFKNMNVSDYETVFGSSEISKIDIASIQFELLFVNVTRDWYDESILHSPFWDINLLNKEEIDIPKISSKLIFIRKVDLKLKPDSQHNRSLAKNTPLNIGPFIMNFSKSYSDKTVALSSINKGLNIDRKVVMNVGAKLREKQRKQPLNKIISQKQKQFIKLAPKLKLKSIPPKSVVQRAKVKPSIYMATPVFTKLHIPLYMSKTNCSFIFKDKALDTVLFVNPETVEIHYQNKPLIITIGNTNKKITATLTSKRDYKLLVELDDYRPVVFHFKTSDAKALTFTIPLEGLQKQEEDNNSFQLIGVIAKTIKPFPNPIKKADYI